MRETSLFHLLFRFFFRALAILCCVVAFFIAMELIKAFNVLYRGHALLGYGFAAGLALVLVLVFLRLFGFVMDHRTLDAPSRPDGEDATHDDMKAYCRYLVHVLKRFGGNPHLEEPLRQQLRQEAYDIDELLGAHPLNDDLRGIIAKNSDGVLQVAMARLREQAEVYARGRMKCVVEDIIQPPFPVVNSLVVVYHEMALVSDIVRTYLGQPALFEQLSVLRDVWHVLIEGRFLSLGQDLFGHVYANTPPLGRAIDDIGPALTSIWLTRVVAMATVTRCEALDEWNTASAINRIESMTEETITSVKDALTEDVFPILKLRLRHSAPDGTTDVAGFTKAIIDGIARSLDTLTKTLKHQPAEKTSFLSRRHTVYDHPGIDGVPHTAERKRRRKRTRGGMFRIFKTFGQRIKYTMGGPGNS